MTTRKRAPVRRRAPSRTKAKPASFLQKARTGGGRQAAYRTYAAELLAHVRQRYEETPEPVPLLAADLGILPTSFYRLARDKGWVRRNDLPARDVPPAMRILEEAKALEAGAGGMVAADEKRAAEPLVNLPPRSGGEGRPPNGSAPSAARWQAQAVGVGGLSGCSKAPPTPDPSPPLAELAGGGERAACVEPNSSELSTIERLERAVLAELATIEAMRAALGTLPQKPPGAARTVRTLSMLTQTLQHLQRLRASAALAAKPIARSDHDDADDDMPPDIDEFRRGLARRIEAFVASRTDPADAGSDAAAGAVDQAR